jgi:hypothetical protein
MKVMMYLRKEIIDSISIESDKLSQPGYLGSCIRKLKEKHTSLIDPSADEPEFILYRLNHYAQQSNVDSGQPTLF